MIIATVVMKLNICTAPGKVQQCPFYFCLPTRLSMLCCLCARKTARTVEMSHFFVHKNVHDFLLIY